jgi:hypothetical protein
VTDLRERAPAHAVMEKLASMRGTDDIRELPLGIIKISKDALNWLRGARGELEMAAKLRRLGDEWTVLHSVPVGDKGSDIDHVVIGPSGVFVINTKRLVEARVWVGRGAFLVNGHKRDYLRYSEFEARRVDDTLRRAGLAAPVVPVIAVCGAKRVTVKSDPKWNDRFIGVADSAGVARRIRRRKAVLSPAKVEQIVAALSDSSAGSRTASASALSADVRAHYDRIDRGVSRWNAMIFLGTLVIVIGGFVLSFDFLPGIVAGLLQR